MSNRSESQLDDIFVALSHEKRRAMIHMLALRPATITQLATAQSESLPAMNKHLRLLEKAQLILRKKVGRTHFVALHKSTLGLVRSWILQYHIDWGNDLETLENYIASLSN